jgi:hypothetical protein
VKKTSYTDNSVQVVFEANPEFAEKVKKRVRELDGRFETETKRQEEENESAGA